MNAWAKLSHGRLADAEPAAARCGRSARKHRSSRQLADDHRVGDYVRGGRAFSATSMSRSAHGLQSRPCSIGGSTLDSIVRVVLGLAIILLSIPRGWRSAEHYDGWDRFILQPRAVRPSGRPAVEPVADTESFFRRRSQMQFELVVVGSGTAAMTAAMRVRKAGRAVAIIDEKPFGGTCALRGCDPQEDARCRRAGGLRTATDARTRGPRG